MLSTSANIDLHRLHLVIKFSYVLDPPAQGKLVRFRARAPPTPSSVESNFPPELGGANSNFWHKLRRSAGNSNPIPSLLNFNELQSFSSDRGNLGVSASGAPDPEFSGVQSSP